jgi:predicted ABC-type ATPase
VVAGPNGSGKTTVTEAGLRHEWFDGCEYVNPDAIAQGFGSWNDPDLVIRAAHEAERRRNACLAESRSLAFETVFSAPDKPEFVARAIELGYFVRLFFVSTNDPALNVARVAQRVALGGHSVPPDKIAKRWSRSISNCAAVAPLVDRLYLYDNSVNDVDARLLLRASCGIVERIYEGAELPEWTRPIMAMLEATAP